MRRVQENTSRNCKTVFLPPQPPWFPPRNPPRSSDLTPKTPAKKPGWSPPPMGFYTGILIKSSPPKGGVHKLQIFSREKYIDFSQNFATPHGGSYRDSHEIVPTKGGVHKIKMSIKELLEKALRNFFGEEVGGVRGTQTPSWKN